MNATGQRKTGEALADTIAYLPDSDATPSGDDPMTNASPKGSQQQRYTFSSGARPLDGYTIKRAIGRGGFGEVYYATSDAGKEVALKLIMRNHEVERRGVVQCMNLKSSHLITIFDIKESESGDTFVVMEYVSGPSLANILAQHPDGLPLQDVRAWLKGLVDGVAYLHDHGIVHRDLKPANIFLEEGIVKIGDYGLSKAMSQSRDSGHSESVGTCHYMAPEISTGKYQKPIDIYAIGIILFEMITGRVPFDGESVGEVLMKHLTTRPDLSPLPEPFRGIVARALAKDPNHRPVRAQDLLLPGDAPREPELRFIGDSKVVAPPLASSGLAAGGKAEEVLHIRSQEESVLYIGPDTVPPPRPGTRRPTIHERFWGVSPIVRAARKRRAAAGTPRPNHRQPPPAYAAAPPQPPLGPPPPLPSGRVRVAELATSMLVAAPATALFSTLSVPIYPMISTQPAIDPSQLAYLFAVVLGGVWSVLVSTKLWEGREVDTSSKRLVLLVLGLILGGIGIGMAAWSHVPTPPSWNGPEGVRDLASWGRPSILDDPSDLAAFIGYFGFIMAIPGWWKMTSRDRSSRFRFLPIIFATTTAGLVGALLPTPPQPWGLLVFGLMALIVQVVSPWDRSAAAYAREQRRRVA